MTEMERKCVASLQKKQKIIKNNKKRKESQERWQEKKGRPIPLFR